MVALAPAIDASGYRRAIGTKSHGVPVPARRCDNLAPRRHVTGPLHPPASRKHRAVTTPAQGAPPARSDALDISPRGDVALAIAVPAGGCDRAIGKQANRMRAARVAEAVYVARCDGNGVGPVVDVALTRCPVPRGQDCAIASQAHGVAPAGGQTQACARVKHAPMMPARLDSASPEREVSRMPWAREAMVISGRGRSVRSTADMPTQARPCVLLA